MGWKASFITIDAYTGNSEEETLEKLGYSNLKSKGKTTFDAVIYPSEGHLYIGRYNGCTIICAADFPAAFFDGNRAAENKLAEAFPNSGLGIFCLHSVVNFFGYAIVQNGRTKRILTGTADDGIRTVFGEILEEEKPFLEHWRHNSDGDRLYSWQDDEYLLAELGEELTFAVTSRFFGKPLDKSDDDLLQTQMTHFSFDGSLFHPKDKKSKRGFWYWVAFALVFLLVRFIAQALK